MSKKLYGLVGGLTTAAAGAAVAIVTYIAPENVGAITTAIGVAEGAIITICGLFVKGGVQNQKK